MCVWKSESAISDFVFLILIVTELWTNGYAQVSCPTGDTSGVVANGQTCAELVSESTMAQCYDPTIESACCSSCNALNTGVDGCEFNDRETCFVFLCPTLVNPADCCATCGTSATTTATGATSTAATSTAATSTAATTTQATEPTTATSPTSATDTTPVQSVTTSTPVPVSTTTGDGTTQSNAATTSITATATGTTVGDVSTTNGTEALQGPNSTSRKRKDAAIIGGTIGGFLGLVLLASVVGLGVHFINKSKLNKVADFNKESMPPEEDSQQQQQPEVVLSSMAPVVPYKATTPNDVTTHSHVTDFSKNQSLKDKDAPLVSIHEGPKNPTFGTDTLLPRGLSAGQGPVMVTKPTSLPPLDSSGLKPISNGGPQTLQNQMQGNISMAGQTAKNDNSVDFLHIEDSAFLTKKN